MKRFLIVLLSAISCTPFVNAEEGMWLPPMIEELNMADLKAKGLELSPREINNRQVFGKALSSSVVQFGNRGTGAVISPEGLMITNHHCAYDFIHRLPDGRKLLADGFWAKDRKEEIPVPGLSVTFIRYMGDVTNEILEGVGGAMDMRDRDQIIESNKNTMLFYYQNMYKDKDLKYSVSNVFNGERYIFTITETFEDVRLVGLPPESIGKFGGEESNWQWPRYTGDFAMFRVYTASNGKSAAYSNKNVPYESKSYITVSGKGYKEGDFAMVLGFPAATQRFFSENDLRFFIDNRIKPMVDVDGQILKVLKEEMDKDETIRFKYAPKYNIMSNFYLKYSGMLEELDSYGVYANAQQRDKRFSEWVAENAGRNKEYVNTLSVISEYNAMHAEQRKAYEYIYETLFGSMDLLVVTQSANRLRSTNFSNAVYEERVAKSIENIYRNFDADVDRKLAYKAFEILMEKVPEQYIPKVLRDELSINFKGNVRAFVDYMYDHTRFASADEFKRELDNRRTSDIWERDYAVRLLTSLQRTLLDISAQSLDAKDNGAMLKKYQNASVNYTNGLKKLGIISYPNAMSNMRFTYGTVSGYEAPERGKQPFYTTLDGLMSNKVEGVKIPEKLNELYKARDFGDYADDDTLKVNFITSTDITGGNSGSPVFNGKGEMTGLIFDSNHESLIGDVDYHGATNRAISVDMRYILFIIDKYAGAQNIIDEITVNYQQEDEKKVAAPFTPTIHY